MTLDPRSRLTANPADDAGAAFDRGALGYAVGLEVVLAGLAAFGGPHGTLGALPWTLQLPGILLVFFVPGNEHFLWRVVGMFLIQCAMWYGILAVGRRRRRSRGAAKGP